MPAFCRLFAALACLTLPLAAQTSLRQRIVLDDQLDPFFRTLGRGDRFGSSLASLGDLNGDGLTEFAVGAPGDHLETGALWLFSLAPNRQISRFVKVGPRENMPEPLKFGARFGSAIVSPGDIDGDGVRDLAVGAPGDSDGVAPPFTGAGAVWILFMNSNGTVRELVKFSRTRGGFGGVLEAGDRFGSALAAPGDLDGNGVPDLVIGAPGDDQGGLSRGALWFVLLESDGTVRASSKVATGTGGLPDVLANQEGFGAALAVLGDLDGDGRSELAVGSLREGGLPLERLRILFLSATHEVTALRELPAGTGRSLAGVGDRNGDGVPDLATDGVMLLLRNDGTLLSQLGSNRGCAALAAPGDLNGDGNPELVLGFPGADFRESDTGSLQIAEMLPGGTIAAASFTGDARNLPMPYAPRSGNFSDRYGTALEPLGDIDDDGEPEIAISAPSDPDGFVGSGSTTGGGAVWIHFIDGPSGARATKISRTRSNLPLDIGDGFGESLASPGDLDGDGTHELVVGAPGDDDARIDGGALYVLFLNRNGALARHTKIRDGAGGFFPSLTATGLGRRLEAIGDLDGDGRRELVVSSASSSSGLVLFVLFLDQDGVVTRHTRLDTTLLPGALPLGGDLAFLEEARSDAKSYLVVSGGGGGSRPVWRLELDSTGQIAAVVQRTVSMSFSTSNEFASAGDLDGNGITDLATLHGGVLEIAFQNGAFAQTDFARFGVTNTTRGLTALGDLTGDGLPDLAAGIITGNSDRVLLFSMDGLATLGFERRDSVDDETLENGRRIPRPHPGRTFVISSEGANLGATIFDSDPAGPNQGNDLTVDSGNVMILQDSLAPTQTTLNVFDHPSDDPDGGLVALDFPRRIRALSVELIDLDPYPNLGAEVHLVDDAGRVRNYIVPAGWTGPFGASHSRKLDLTTLAPQPGAGPHDAVAFQPPGFDAARVVRVEVRLLSGGAFDDLVYDPYP